MSISFNTILDAYRKESFSERDKGDRFERLMQAYLQTDPTYAYKLKKVWLWSEFHQRHEFGGGDTGIDLVALTVDGDYWAIQCKCFQEDAAIDKPAVDSFLSTSSREFKNEDLKTVRFAHRYWISTTNRWGRNAEEAIKNQNPPVTRINLHDLQEAAVDWEKLDKGLYGEASRSPKKTIKAHQREALEKTREHFKNADRGKLIMACGTGKTFTSLRIAEKETNGKGLILFLLPSIALLGQTLREWSSDADEPINAICICSDPKVTRKRTKNNDIDSFSVVDLALPASTNVNDILQQFGHIKAHGSSGMTVVFSTYQSIGIISQAQKELRNVKSSFGEFDLIVCDEAHRTTGVTLSDEDSSAFVKVHDNDFIQAKKRLYMTATPRLYSDDTKSKAAQAEAVLCSMDDVALYGEEIYRIGFGEAVDRDLLTDYKVLVLTMSEKDISLEIQRSIAGENKEIATDDITKIIGSINALSKQILGDEGIIKASDPEPMRRAVAFCQNIAISKTITETYNTSTEVYLNSLPAKKKEKMVSVEAQHIDGTMSAPERDEKLSWLKSETNNNECRILTNVRCLSEGVDVPSLDAVLFLSARNSQVDVVQSVGRVMRKSEGKKYGYIIIPVVVPADVEADKALDDNERYKVVWTVLNALRAHDDRFNATVNKIELNRKRPEQIIVGGMDHSYEEHEGGASHLSEDQKPFETSETKRKIAIQLTTKFEELQHVMFARMVQKVGDRRYWEQWAKNVAEIAERQIERISRLIEESPTHHKAFASFLSGLQKNINPSIAQGEAVEMLSQHIITRPVFEALFEGYSFVKNNPISFAMQKMLDLLEAQAVEKDTETLQKFYESVKMRASGIDNAEGKQKIIIELYDKFFKTAFPKMVEKLGIVYTPVEVVDFIIHSVNDILKKEFDRSISDENIHVLDPFTGTGTFVTRLIQSGLIDPKDLRRKYHNEIHANEIVLLAYYIAAVNIENAYHDAINLECHASSHGKAMRDASHSTIPPLKGVDSSSTTVEEEDGGCSAVEYQPFNGICLTDTFQLGESNEGGIHHSEMFPKNSDRVANQKKAPLRIIMGNPPYSVGQKSANDNSQNQSYPKLDGLIAKTYAALTNATLRSSLYDSYIKAFRWSADRLDPKNGGIICFVSNGAWIDGNAQDGFRKCLEKEFSSIYVFNLRGNQRTSGELSRKEGGKIFGSGSRTPIAITLLVKNPKAKNEKATIHYHDIGDYLKREEKLAIVKKFGSIANKDMSWQTLNPNESGDWINHGNDIFETFFPLGDKKEEKEQSFFAPYYGRGLATSRDAWCYNSSRNIVLKNINDSINYFNEQSVAYKNAKKENPILDVNNFITANPKKFSWDRAQKFDLGMFKQYKFNSKSLTSGIYRPFYKQWVYFNRQLNNCVYKLPSIFPTPGIKNLAICVSGTTKNFSVIIADAIPDLHFNGDTQAFPLHYYEERKAHQEERSGFFDMKNDDKYVRRDGVSDFILGRCRDMYGKNVGKEDVFYYVYGFLHSPDYRTTFANDLKKSLPRLPLVEDVKDFWKFSKAGRALADLHVNYEKVPPCPDVTVTGASPVAAGFTPVAAMRDASHFGNAHPLDESIDVIASEAKQSTQRTEQIATSPSAPRNDNSHPLDKGGWGDFRVQKMRFPKKGQKDAIIYNSKITIGNIPPKAYEYVVNGKSAIEWVMERYQITTHKESGITNDPNDWAKEVGNPRYILDLLLSVINLSLQTVDIVESLPKVSFEQ